MKVYSIPSPDVLARAADVAKWQDQRIQILNYVALWRRRIQAAESEFPHVTLELGRQAQLFHHDDGKKLLGTMYVTGARQFVEDEGLVEA